MSAKTIKTAIRKFNKFLITAHINPEGDSIGSQVAMASLLKKLGKSAIILNEGPVPYILQFMKGTEEIMKEMPASFDFEAAVILDCPDLSRVGNAAEHITKEKNIINIDHHVSNENFGKYNWVDTERSSAGEMVFELFKAFKLKLDYDDAVAIYVAMMTDTGSFKYSNTTSRTHSVTAELIDAGVRPYEIYGRIYETNSIQNTSLLGEALQTLKVSDDGKIAWLWVTREMLKKTKASLEGTEGIINFARSIESSDIAILFRETGTENRVKVSFRSKGNVDVNKLAASFGGGGHATASGCTVFGKIEEVEKKVLEKASGMLG
ncbi:MAG: bifunctional oligoribonuclease/PAP phosphatase NrnA [Candidatus Omnitrophica bacterium]|nr:bifunctional oligoribonuclease/PAP phosphatase NrnA [Candidatus Omnitrophota bacterium]